MDQVIEQWEEIKEEMIDENDWLQCLRVLNSREAIHQIIQYSRDGDPIKWSRHFQTILDHVIQLVKDTEVRFLFE